MEEIVIKVDIPAEFKQEFESALAKVVKQFVMNLKLSVINEISEIKDDDFREVKDSVVQDVIKSTEETLRKIKFGEIKPMNLDEFNHWCDSILKLILQKSK